MISSVGSNSSWSSAIFSKLDTKNQGYIEKSDLEAAFAKVDSSSGTTTDNSVADKVFEKLDTDSDGKVTKDEMSTALDKMASQLNAQFDQSRVRAGMGGGHGGGMPPQGSTSGTESTQSSSDSSYIAAADTNGDGTVSEQEKLAYEQSAQQSDGTSSTSSSNATTGMEDIRKLMAAGGMPPPPPHQGINDAGFSKDELTSQIESLNGNNSKRTEFLTSLVNNFDKADANSDGKIDHSEAHAFRESSKTSDTQALSRIIQLLRMYGADDTTTASTASTLSVTA